MAAQDAFVLPVLLLTGQEPAFKKQLCNFSSFLVQAASVVSYIQSEL